MIRAGRAIFSAVALAAARLATAEEPSSGHELTLRAEGFRPAIDSDFAAGSGPYALAFGSSRAWGGRLEYAKTWSTVAGTLGLGGGLGYLGAYGHGLYRDPSTGELAVSGDSTALHLIPTSAFATWRLDRVGRWTRIPLAPYARVSLERYNWIATGTGHASRYGATNGYALAVGAALFLDAIDPSNARELARETSIRRTAFTFEVSRSRVDDFGSSRSWDLSSDGWAMSAGLLLGF